MNVVTGYSPSKTERALPRVDASTYTPYRLNIGMKPAEPMMQVVTSWLEASHIPPPSKPTIFIHDTKYVPHTRRRKIFIQFEPDIIYNMRQHLLENYKKYDYIVTFDDVVLKSCPNANKYVCAACWVPYSDILSIDVSKKEFKLTAVFTHMWYGVGHVFRRIIYANQREIQMPRMFYRSSMRGELEEVENNPVFPSKSSKIELFKTAQFSLVIENSEQVNYFTEKIIDCLITRTIPVYWGCPNIHDYFDTTGWIVLKNASFDELQEKLSALTPDHYSRYTDVIEKNFKTAMCFANYYENLKRGLLSIPGY